MGESLSFVPIHDLNNELLLPWLDLYETAFPPNEKILVSSIIKIISDKSDNTQEMHIIAGLDEDEKFICMAMYQLPTNKPVGVLWYMAVAPDQRGKGWGSKTYQGILSQLNPNVHKALVFEVEIPGESHSSPDAEKRIQFYQRNGAKLLTGIHYLQNVGWHQPPTPMHIMIHPLQPLNAEAAFELAHSIFEEAMQKISTLMLE